jgi:hypothetical protein
VKTILCYGDSNTWGCIPLTGAEPARRFGPAQRWPGVLRRELGDGFWIVEEGLNGIAAGAGLLLDIVGASGCGPEGSPPQALLVCPPPVGRLGLFEEEFAGAVERSRDLARHLAAVADARSCPWIDAGAHVRSSDNDGIHLDAPSHEQLGVVGAQHVRLLLA